LWLIFVWTSATLKFDPENGGQMCVKLYILTRKVSRQIKNFFHRIETYSSSFRMLKEFECTSYFKPTSLHPRKSVFSFAERLMIRSRYSPPYSETFPAIWRQHFSHHRTLTFWGISVTSFLEHLSHNICRVIFWNFEMASASICRISICRITFIVKKIWSL
jgi:hypothetical protein